MKNKSLVQPQLERMLRSLKAMAASIVMNSVRDIKGGMKQNANPKKIIDKHNRQRQRHIQNLFFKLSHIHLEIIIVPDDDPFMRDCFVVVNPNKVISAGDEVRIQ